VNCGFTVPHSDRAHAYLCFRLANSGHLDVKAAGQNLDILRTERNRADYDVDRPYNHAKAMPLVQAAKDVIAVLEVAENEPTKTLITDAMKIYERDVLKNVTWHP